MFSSPASVTVRITSGKPFSPRIYKLYILPVHEWSQNVWQQWNQWSDEAGRKWWLLRGGERARSVWLGAYDEASSRWRPIQIRSPRGGDGVVLATATGTTPGAGQCVAILRPPAKSVLVKPPPRRNCTTRFCTFSLLFFFFSSFVFIVFLLVFPDCFGSWKELSEAHPGSMANRWYRLWCVINYTFDELVFVDICVYVNYKEEWVIIFIALILD